MKRILAAALAILLAVTLAGCGAGKTELVLVTDSGSVEDGSFNQSAWEGLVRYAEENKISSGYFQPEENTDEALRGAIDKAVEGGARAVVCTGYLFEDVVAEAQQAYPEVDFIAVDCEVASPAANTVGLTYAEEQAGFLAGYAAVTEGYRSLGFLGGDAVPGVQRYGLGFVQGAEYAARELELEEGSVAILYAFTDGFDPSDDTQATAEAWYADGVECIFAANGGAQSSVTAAAEKMGGVVICADTDHSAASEAVVVSALKSISTSVYSTIDGIYDGSFEGGRNLHFDAASSGVALSMDTAHFKNFTQTAYDTMLTKLQTNAEGVTEAIVRQTTDDGAIEGVETALVTVRELR